MKWFDQTDNSRPVVSPQAQIEDFLQKRGEIPDFKVYEHFLMLLTGCDIPTLKQHAQAKEEDFPLPAFLGKRTLYTTDGNPRISVVEKTVGTPVAVDAIEVAIAMGARELFFFGLCGSVGDSVDVGDLIVPIESIREEGTSYHYLPTKAIAVPDDRLAQKLVHYLGKQEGLRIHSGTTVSTDAVFRQTLRKERGWRKQGILGVDMEMSALFAVAKFYQLQAVALLVVSDKHGFEKDNKWQWGGKGLAESRARAIRLFVEFIRKEGAQNQHLNATLDSAHLVRRYT